MKPQFQHDCDKCEFLGSFDYQGCLVDGSIADFTADLYVCRGVRNLGRGKDDTLIARLSDEGSDYCSGWPEQYVLKVNEPIEELSTHGPAMIEAYKRWSKAQIR